MNPASLEAEKTRQQKEIAKKNQKFLSPTSKNEKSFSSQHQKIKLDSFELTQVIGKGASVLPHLLSFPFLLLSPAHARLTTSLSLSLSLFLSLLFSLSSLSSLFLTGSFGKVVLVRKKDTGELYAMKILNKENIIKRKQVDHTKTERAVLSFTRHSFIVSLHWAFQTKSKLYFVLDYCR